MISFIVPAYNEEAVIEGTLDAIRAAAQASAKPYEVIVVNDASTDRTEELARKHGANIIRVSHRKIAAVRNSGAKVASGDIFFFVDADTLVTPLIIKNAIFLIDQGFIGGGARLRFDGELPWWGRVLMPIFTAVYFAANLGAGCFLFVRRDAFEAIGGFDETYYAGEEIYFTKALRKCGRFRILGDHVLTSGRKLRIYSAGNFLRLLLSFIFAGRKALLKREYLGMWYSDRRESASRPSN